MSFVVTTSIRGESIVKTSRLVVETVVKSAVIREAVVKVVEASQVDTSQFLRVVIDENAKLTLQDGNGTVVEGV